jgi:hypothetical protein
MVEIVGVLVVAQQHRVDLADCIRGQGRTRSLGQGDIAQPVLTGSIEADSVTRRKPPASISTVGPPMSVMFSVIVLSPDHIRVFGCL